MQLIENDYSYSCSRLSQEHIRALASKLCAKILQVLTKHPDGISAAAIAKELQEHEQKIYYHIRRLLKASVIVIDRTEDTKGGTAKIVRLKTDAYAIVLGKSEKLVRHTTINALHEKYLAPFIEHGKLNCCIIVGSPDPHGPAQARSRDAAYAIDLGIFLGSQLSVRATPSVQLDTDLRDWSRNLIIIGGPVVNKAAERINSKSPARYDVDTKSFIVGKKRYTQDTAGTIVKMRNPYAPGKWILYISGKRYGGTQAAILAFIQEFDYIAKKKLLKDESSVCVVIGVDNNSDGIVDSVKFID